MTVRKNAKFLDATERENLARAFVMMRADIVNPAAPPADRYSRWEEYVAVHRMIQNANAPGEASPVNFGHGGAGAYGFFSWHRYFLLLLEQQLQSYVPGVALPYWDWTDPIGTIMVADFLGPNGDPASGNQVRQGYFAAETPGSGANLTPLPAWWPAGLTGFTLHATFGVNAGPLRRNVVGAGSLPSIASIRSALDKVTYPTFQSAVEAGTGTVPFHQLHNGLHTWFGGAGSSHMASTIVSPFDPMFYLHHCNIDRLWAMWQADGHALEYPMAGGAPQHHLNDPMYPWVGVLAGYSSNYSFPPIVMPDFSALGVITPADVLDHRALGYTYDTLAVVGIALDRTGSMLGMTPDPMTVGAPDVTKWEAAKRGVSAFLQDCEAAYQSAEAYVVAGAQTFRRLLANEFAPVFAGTPYGLVKAGGAYGQAAFDAAIAGLSPGGSTPLADALVDAHATLVAAPYGGPLADERRYLALLTDGLLTAGTPIASVPDASLANTTVFAMGFGTGADVDYATLAALIAKGQVATTPFHGESAGAIDKFYSQALADALGFTPIMDPVLELSDGEHVHLGFVATSAEETFFITAQGMDFQDPGWAFQLIGPDGSVIHADGGVPAHAHAGAAHAGGRPPIASTRRGRGRLSLFLQRDNADASAWIGDWTLVIARRARELDAMVMLDPGELILPVTAGPARGPRYARLLTRPDKRKAARALAGGPRHRLDVRPSATARSERPACSVVVNIYARTRLRVQLAPQVDRAQAGASLAVEVQTDVLRGAASALAGFARLVAPVQDLAQTVRSAKLPARVLESARLQGDDRIKLDSALVLAHLEARRPVLARVRDEEVAVVSHHGGPLHLHVHDTSVPGAYHLGLWIEGSYRPGGNQGAVHHGAHAGSGAQAGTERFLRVLSTSVALSAKRRSPTPKREPAKRGARRT